MRYSQIDTIIQQGISYLFSQQQADGSFLSLSSSSPSAFKTAQIFHTTFFTSLILQSLNKLSTNTDVDIMRKKAATFLVAQKSNYWSWNYWMRQSQQAKELPYPDDLDDTFCALAGLTVYKPSLIDGKALAHIVQLLTAVETEEGGPYITWLVDKNVDKHWKDIDIAVNANIAYFLSLQGVTLPKLTTFFKKTMRKRLFVSPYYPSVFPVIYFLSRLALGREKNNMITFLLDKKKNGYWENPLHTALAVLSLIQMGQTKHLSSAIEYLIRMQQNGIWKPFAFCMDPVINKKKCYAGSTSLTTAFSLVALKEYQRLQESKLLITTRAKEKDNTSIAIYTYAMKHFNHLSPILAKQGKDMLEVTKKVENIFPVSLIPYYFKEALGKKGKNIPSRTVITLGVATLLGWIAYTIYDNFFDDEGDTALLSLANACLRELTSIYITLLPQNSEFISLFNNIMNQLDSANTWEIMTTRRKLNIHSIFSLDTIPYYGNFLQLSQKSFGYALSPIALLFALGYQTTSLEIQFALVFFKHLLIAKQLNDDMHDFKEDLEKGYINAVSSRVMKALKKQTKQSSTTIDEIQEVFWKETVFDICKVINRHSNQAIQALEKNPAIEDTSSLTQLLHPIMHAAQEALDQKQKAQEFLSTYI